MAGKTKKTGARPQSSGGGRPMSSQSPRPQSARGEDRGIMQTPMKGHMALKSSPFAPTDCKLMSQYMVLDHMSAHYNKLHKAKSAIDASCPKTWQASQKMRDRAKRESLKADLKRKEKEDKIRKVALDSTRADSEQDRAELAALYEAYSARDDEGYLDELDGKMITEKAVKTHTEKGAKQRKDIRLVNRMVDDTANPPSHYHRQEPVKSNIPESRPKSALKPTHNRTSNVYKSSVNNTYSQPRSQYPPQSQYYEDHGDYSYDRSFSAGRTQTLKPGTPRSGGDLVEVHANKFTESKPFQPRTLKSKYNVPSTLSKFKYYNPPKREAEETQTNPGSNTYIQGTDETDSAPMSQTKDLSQAGTTGPTKTLRSTRKGSIVSRPETPYAESIDWMNETLMSRDDNFGHTPTGVPPLNISLDADHMHWLKDQAEKAQLRLSNRTPTSQRTSRQLAASQTLNQTQTMPQGTVLGQSRVMPEGIQLQGNYTMNSLNGTQDREEEIKYLEFIQDVTNDVLDRGIFTNRVLKQVFENHIDKRRGELKISKMRDMLEDLRIDLGIPPADGDEGLGHSSTHSIHDIDSEQDKPKVTPRANRRRGMNGTLGGPETMLASQKPNLPHLRGSRRSKTPDAKPPLPRPNSRGSRSRPGSSASLRNSKEDPFQDMGGTLKTSTYSQSLTNGTADILTIEHEDLDLVNGNDGNESPEQTPTTVTPLGTSNEAQTSAFESTDVFETTNEIQTNGIQSNGVNSNGVQSESNDTKDDQETIYVSDVTSAYQKHMEATLYEEDEFEDEYEDEFDQTATDNGPDPVSGNDDKHPIETDRTIADTDRTYGDTSRTYDDTTDRTTPTPIPRKRGSTADLRDSARTTSDTIEVSELDENEDDVF